MKKLFRSKLSDCLPKSKISLLALSIGENYLDVFLHYSNAVF